MVKDTKTPETPAPKTMRVKMLLQVGLDRPDVDGLTIYPKDSVAELPVKVAERLIRSGSATKA